MNLPNKQKGLSSIGWLFVGLTCFFYAVILFKIVPVYLDDLSVKSAIDKLSVSASDKVDPTEDVLNALEKQFDVENIRDLNVRKEGVVAIDRKDNGTVSVVMNYEVAVSIFKDNGLLQTMDVVIRFKHKKELR